MISRCEETRLTLNREKGVSFIRSGWCASLIGTTKQVYKYNYALGNPLPTDGIFTEKVRIFVNYLLLPL
ncbi:hypothetical protein DP113_02490 [Brasilonema octagenarum UFV-E1]|jgi:hypothetical protein|uniref:Uncharacterized protein n=2 Tax=Brasilonema TaxID=383614 RepID=A0A856M873_9CYAN|nr:hypothetical protein [Brasilonema octagenarum UFV-OR1]QDL06932.1 hypothetical protein DP114_02535 [Brasilonema sennae CENA114]QDL13295.1 hypothetical protein DP113_02490 [Brasilonema octagenarum UFV-E1]